MISGFCLVVALVQPHVPWVMGDHYSQYPDDKIDLPLIWWILRSLVMHSPAISLRSLIWTGKLGKFWIRSRQQGLKRMIRWCYSHRNRVHSFPGVNGPYWDNGLHTALVARWPGKTPAGKRTDAMVSVCGCNTNSCRNRRWRSQRFRVRWNQQIICMF